jgi:hypothetical protein
MDLNLEHTKIELIQWLSTLDDAKIIRKVLKLRESERSDWAKSISEDERNSIKLGIEDADNGNLIDHSEARKIYGKWL